MGVVTDMTKVTHRDIPEMLIGIDQYVQPPSHHFPPSLGTVRANGQFEGPLTDCVRLWHNGGMIDPASIDLHRFLTDWYGSPATPSSALPAEYNWLPEPLKDWYSLSARWTSPVVKLKRMIAPEQITQSDGKAVFMKDPTGDWLWAFDMEDKTAVYDAELHEGWERTSEPLSEFLIHNTLNETVYGASNWRECTQVEADFLAEILAPMTEVSFGGWRWPRPGGRVFKSEALVAEVGPAMDPNAPWEDRPGYAEVRVAAINPAHLAYLDQMASIKWLGSR